jgi:hypothetical protein
MAGTALCIEVRLAGCRIAHEDVQCNWWPGRRSALSLCSRSNAGDVFRNGSNVILRNGHRWHWRQTWIFEAVSNNGKDHLSSLVVEHNGRAEQVGSSTLASAKVSAVTGGAVRRVEGVATRSQCRIDDTLLGRKVCRRRPASSTAIALCAGSGGYGSPASTTLLPQQNRGDAQEQA